jgi:hypothetical protein
MIWEGDFMSGERTDGAGGPVYPPPNFPLLFADNVSNFAYGQSLIRLFFVRNDPSFNVGTDQARSQPIAQLVMPIDGFVATALFFEHVLSLLVSENVLSQARVDELRSMSPER